MKAPSRIAIAQAKRKLRPVNLTVRFNRKSYSVTVRDAHTGALLAAKRGPLILPEVKTCKIWPPADVVRSWRDNLIREAGNIPPLIFVGNKVLELAGFMSNLAVAVDDASTTAKFLTGDLKPNAVGVGADAWKP